MFRPEDSEYEVACMNKKTAMLDVYPSIWGHWAGGPPGNVEDVEWLDVRLKKMFEETRGDTRDLPVLISRGRPA